METKTLARWKQACDFQNIYESGFLPTLQSLDLDCDLCLDECRKQTPLTQCYVAIVQVNLPGAIRQMLNTRSFGLTPFLNLYNLYLSHFNLHLPGLAVIIGIDFLSSSLPQATSGLVSPCIMDPALCASNRQKARKLG